MSSLTIHRGTNEIGGSCVELKNGSESLIIDFGLPMMNQDGSEFDGSMLNKKDTEELVKLGILPNIAGLYSGKEAIAGILLSHAHIDHFGLLGFIKDEIPVYMGEATGKLIEINNIFLTKSINIRNANYFSKNQSFNIGNFRITPYWSDHSAFDAYSFLIEIDGKRIFYSGDFRGHGRKSGAYRWFLNNAPENVDYLIIEGTSIGRNAGMSETDVEKELINVFRSTDSICYVWTSSQNIDRLVSIYKACLKNDKTFVVDIYTANILNILSNFAKLPTPLKNYSNIKVLFTNRVTTKLLKNNKQELVYPFTKYKVKSEDIANNPGQYVMLVRPSMLPEIKKINQSNGKLIYSMWSGYKLKKDAQKFLDYFEQNQFDILDIHSSGHADEKTLKELANAINPKAIIPIHTTQKIQYSNIFSQKIIILEDKQIFEI